MGRKLMLVGGAKPQLRKPRAKGWTRAKQAEFLTVLGETCNVSQAARQAGVSVTHAYRKRKMDAGFRASWIEAVGSAYQRLELALLDRAFNGTEKVTTRRDGSEERVREVSNQLGLALLKMHRDTAAAAASELPPDDLEALRERVMRKLDRLREREAARDEAGETSE